VRNRQQMMREAASLIKDVEPDQTKAAQEASPVAQKAAKDRAQAEKDAAQESFRKWKNAMDAQHMAAMQAWDTQWEKIKGAEQSAASFNNELTSLIKAQIGLSALHSLASQIGDSLRRTAEEVIHAAEQFQQLREAMQEVAALSEKQTQTSFTLEQVAKGQAAGLKPEEWRRAQETFLNFAGAQVGNQPGAKMTGAQAEAFQARIAAATKSQGFAPELGMEFGGAILQQSKGPLTPE
jgi:hypothetical protein